jgi:hypothetical protein
MQIAVREERQQGCLFTHQSSHRLKNWKARFLVKCQTVSAGETLHCQELRLL